MATEEQAFRADQMENLLRTDGWRFYHDHVLQELDGIERKILSGSYRTLEEYTEACGKRAAYKKVLRIPHIIRNEAGYALPPD